ncbi:hypothetical protein B0181_11420 [Moraxella caviae]|nr:hypothetical protein B0181_11420 [Moraxella caviae]
MDFNALARLDTEVLLSAATDPRFAGKQNLQSAYAYHIEKLFETLLNEKYGEIALALLRPTYNGFFPPSATAYEFSNVSLTLEFENCSQFVKAVQIFEEFNEIMDFDEKISLRGWGETRTGRIPMSHEAMNLFHVYCDLLVQIELMLHEKRYQELVDMAEGVVAVASTLSLDYGKFLNPEHLERILNALLTKAARYSRVEMQGRTNILPFSFVGISFKVKGIEIVADPEDEDDFDEDEAS